MQLRTEPPSSEEATELSKGYQAACHSQGHYGRTCSQALHVLKGICVDVRACAMDPMKISPVGRAVSAEGGVAVHRGDAKWSCPD